MSTGAYLYILRCADGSYFPVTVVFAEPFDRITDAVAAERQIKGWSRAKKEALINGELHRLSDLAKRRSSHNPTTSS